MKVPGPGVRVARRDAEATRRRLLELDALRLDLEVDRHGDEVVFPVADSCGPLLPTEPWQFTPRALRPRSYQDLLPEALRATAPRAFDTLGDILIVKVPEATDAERAAIGEALLRFHGARAVFHDAGVTGTFRTRRLERIAGTGGSRTVVRENGLVLQVDPAAAYFSPRLGQERERVAAQCRPGEVAVDLFGGVGAQAILLARAGAVVHCVDLNPAASELAARNATANGVQVTVHTGDARALAPGLPAADRILMNLPHGASGFLDAAVAVAGPRARIHYHEILAGSETASRVAWLERGLAALGREARVVGTRAVRNYSPQEEHVVFDVDLT